MITFLQIVKYIFLILIAFSSSNVPINNDESRGGNWLDYVKT